MNLVSMTIINPRKEYWLSRESNQRPPVLKSATQPTALWDSASVFSVSFSNKLNVHNCSHYLSNGNIWAYEIHSAFSGDKLNVAQVMIFVIDKLENMVRKGENAGLAMFFKSRLFSARIKPSALCGENEVESL